MFTKTDYKKDIFISTLEYLEKKEDKLTFLAIIYHLSSLISQPDIYEILLSFVPKDIILRDYFLEDELIADIGDLVRENERYFEHLYNKIENNLHGFKNEN